MTGIGNAIALLAPSNNADQTVDIQFHRITLQHFLLVRSFNLIIIITAIYD
jgi:hypothetical protein